MSAQGVPRFNNILGLRIWTAGLESLPGETLENGWVCQAAVGRHHRRNVADTSTTQSDHSAMGTMQQAAAD
jgi:hypothetical protein